ncbi:MAG: hypothetical protein ACE5H9_15015 [Anaerolineae bacterium]
MVVQLSSAGKWLTVAVSQVKHPVTWLVAPPPVPLERPSLSQLAQPGANLPRFVAECAVACKYLGLLGSLDWDNFPERPADRPWPGPKPQARAPFVAAYLVKLDQHLRYMTHLRQYLVEHPALVWVLGFPLMPCDEFSWGFDVEANLPSSRQFSRVLRTLDNTALQFLLDASVTLLQEELPEEVCFGQTVALDTKHILAWVKENNPKAYLKESDRLDKDRQPKGDPDCRRQR